MFFEKKQFFYTENDPGNSSLLRPTKSLGNPIKKVKNVLTIPFSDLLKKIDYKRFEYIELVKIDTQGKDLEIIKSAKEYLEKIVFLNCEINTFDHYTGNHKAKEIEDFLESKGFIKLFNNSFVNDEPVDATFINKKFLHLKKIIDYEVL